MPTKETAHTVRWATHTTEVITHGDRLTIEWNLRERCAVHSIEDDGQRVQVAAFFSAEDARRAVACVNACLGISTENLEQNLPVKELAESYNTALIQRDTMQAKLARIQAAAIPLNDAMSDSMNWPDSPSELLRVTEAIKTLLETI